MTAPERRLARLSYEEAGELLARGAVALLPTGSVEPHGPHLSLRTDTIIAEHAAVRAADSLSDAGIPACVLPALPYGVTHYALGFAGVIGVSADTLGAVIQDVARELKRGGARLVCLVNAHLEPDHLAALARAAASVRTAVGLAAIVPDLTRRELAQRLGDEFRSGACHAGSFETSLVLAAVPAEVREERRRDLVEVPISLSRAIRDGKRTFHEAGLTRAYCGAPAKATAGQGESTYAVLAEILVEAVRAALREGA